MQTQRFSPVKGSVLPEEPLELEEPLFDTELGADGDSVGDDEPLELVDDDGVLEVEVEVEVEELELLEELLLE